LAGRLIRSLSTSRRIAPKERAVNGARLSRA
jgi:hypothetical protein